MWISVKDGVNLFKMTVQKNVVLSVPWAGKQEARDWTLIVTFPWSNINWNHTIVLPLISAGTIFHIWIDLCKPEVKEWGVIYTKINFSYEENRYINVSCLLALAFLISIRYRFFTQFTLTESTEWHLPPDNLRTLDLHIFLRFSHTTCTKSTETKRTWKVATTTTMCGCKIHFSKLKKSSESLVRGLAKRNVNDLSTWPLSINDNQIIIELYLNIILVW